MLSFLAILAAIPGTWSASSTLTIYEHGNSGGSSRTLHGAEPNFGAFHWNDAASSVTARGGSWELYTDNDYQGSRMVVPNGHSINVYHNDAYSSARPICAYASNPEAAKLVVYEHHNSQGAQKEFLVDSDYVGDDWNDLITSVYAAKGDWELYEHASYEGLREVVRQGQSININNDRVSSLKPICETYRKTCTLKKVTVIDNGQMEPKYENTEIIGSQDSGSCYGRASQTLTLSSADSVEESSTFEISKSDEINWSLSVSVEVEASAKILGSGGSVTAGVSASVGGAHSITTTNSKSFSKGNEKLVGLSITFNTPGAAIVFGSVDRYTIDNSNIPADMHMECPDGSTFTKRSTIKLKSVTYPSAHFWSLNGEFSAEACNRDWTLAECVRGVRQQHSHFVGRKEEIRRAFNQCFANGKGKVGK